jgi:hypothetical protein
VRAAPSIPARSAQNCGGVATEVGRANRFGVVMRVRRQRATAATGAADLRPATCAAAPIPPRSAGEARRTTAALPRALCVQIVLPS